MKIFLWLDDWLFDYIFQPILNKLQWSAVEVTKFCIIGIMVATIANAYLLYTDHKLYENIIIIAANLVVNVLFYAIVENTHKKHRPGMRNSRRISNFELLWRFYNLTMLVYTLFGIFIEPIYFTLMSNFLLFSASYFIACDEPPPPTPKAAPVYGNFAHSEG